MQKPAYCAKVKFISLALPTFACGPKKVTQKIMRPPDWKRLSTPALNSSSCMLLAGRKIGRWEGCLKASKGSCPCRQLATGWGHVLLSEKGIAGFGCLEGRRNKMHRGNRKVEFHMDC